MKSLQGRSLLCPALPLEECVSHFSHGYAGHALQCQNCAWCLSDEGRPSNTLVLTGGRCVYLLRALRPLGMQGQGARENASGMRSVRTQGIVCGPMDSASPCRLLPTGAPAIQQVRCKRALGRVHSPKS